MTTATQEQIVKSHARAKVADAISEVTSTTDNKLTITTSILFNDFPCVTNYGYYGTDQYDVYAIIHRTRRIALLQNKLQGSFAYWCNWICN